MLWFHGPTVGVWVGGGVGWGGALTHVDQCAPKSDRLLDPLLQASKPLWKRNGRSLTSQFREVVRVNKFATEVLEVRCSGNRGSAFFFFFIGFRFGRFGLRSRSFFGRHFGCEAHLYRILGADLNRHVTSPLDDDGDRIRRLGI